MMSLRYMRNRRNEQGLLSIDWGLQTEIVLNAVSVPSGMCRSVITH